MERLRNLRRRRLLGEYPPSKRRGTFDLVKLLQRFDEHGELYDVHLRLTQTYVHRQAAGTWA